MKYFQLADNHSDDLRGPVFPQAETTTVFQAQLITPWHLFDPHPKLKYKLASKAKLTDVLTNMTSTNSGFLINDKVRSLLEEHHLMRHQYFETEVKVGSKFYTYYWLHLTQPDLSEHIDFVESTFIELDYCDAVGEIKLQSLDHYKELKAKDKMASFGVELKQLRLKDSFDFKLDLFKFLPFTSEIIISNKLKESIESSGIKGFEITESNII